MNTWLRQPGGEGLQAVSVLPRRNRLHMLTRWSVSLHTTWIFGPLRTLRS